MTSRILMAAAFATALAAAPALAQTPAAPAPGTQHPGTAPATSRPTPMPNLTFEEIVGDIPASQNISPGAIVVGAITGVIVLNIVAPGLWPASYITGGPLVGTIFADSALAASRVYAVTSAAIGGWTGQWVYANWLSR